MDNVQDKITGEPLIPARPGGGMRRGLVAGIAAIFVVILSAGWMVFPYFLDGHRILQGVGSSLETEQRGTAATVSRLLTRVAEYPGQTGCRVALNWALPQSVWRNGSILARNNSGPARPYMARLRVFRRLI